MSFIYIIPLHTCCITKIEHDFSYVKHPVQTFKDKHKLHNYTIKKHHFVDISCISSQYERLYVHSSDLLGVKK